jgi:hypothetical protein
MTANSSSNHNSNNNKDETDNRQKSKTAHHGTQNKCAPVHTAVAKHHTTGVHVKQLTTI